MTKTALKAYIQKDLKKLRAERIKITPKKETNSSSCKNETLRNYLATRENTLKEILSLI